jgi:hypothetical protein
MALPKSGEAKASPTLFAMSFAARQPIVRTRTNAKKAMMSPMKMSERGRVVDAMIGLLELRWIFASKCG